MAEYVLDNQDLFEADLDNLIRAAIYRWYVLDGCGVTALAVPGMAVQVAAGNIRHTAATVAVAASASFPATGIPANAGANPRIDIVSVSSTGVLTYTTGTAAPVADAEPPALPAAQILLAYVTVPGSATNVQNANITNRRIINAAAELHAASHNVAGTDTPIPLKYLDKGNSGAAAQTFDWTAATTQKLTLTGNPASFAFTAPPAGTWLALEIAQDATGSRTIPAFPTVKWIGGTQPTATTTASKKDLYTFFYDGTDYIGSGAMNA